MCKYCCMSVRTDCEYCYSRARICLCALVCSFVECRFFFAVFSLSSFCTLYDGEKFARVPNTLELSVDRNATRFCQKRLWQYAQLRFHRVLDAFFFFAPSISFSHDTRDWNFAEKRTRRLFLRVFTYATLGTDVGVISPAAIAVSQVF